MLNWMKRSKGHFLTEHEGKSFFEEAKRALLTQRQQEPRQQEPISQHPLINQVLELIHQEPHFLETLILGLDFRTIFQQQPALLGTLVSQLPQYIQQLQPLRDPNQQQEFSTLTNFTQIGPNIFYNPEDFWTGSNGTVVYKGFYEVPTKKAAVKRIIKSCHELYKNEIDLLRKVDCPYVLKYFTTHTDNDFHYIATELAQQTLEEYIKNKMTEDLIKVLEEACEGLKFLHEQNPPIVHRDIKPTNILISFLGGQSKAMIADFGISKTLTKTTQSTIGSTVKGTHDWLPPEALEAAKRKEKYRATKPHDIFSMGCVAYYTLTKGEHPFGEEFYRAGNIINGTFDLKSLETEKKLIYLNLVKAMLQMDKSKRPPIEAVLKHPSLWNKKRLDFFKQVKKRLKEEEKLNKRNSQLLQTLEASQSDICKGDWTQLLCQQVQTLIKNYPRKPYNPKSVQKLIEFIRDKYEHDDEWPTNVKKLFETTNYIDYFTSRFPRLLVHTYVVMQECKQDEKFRVYYDPSVQRYFFPLPPCYI